MKKLILAVTALLLPFAFYSCKSGDDDSSSDGSGGTTTGTTGNNANTDSDTIPLTNLYLSTEGNSKTVYVGETLTITATTEPEDATENIKWTMTASPEPAATFESDGKTCIVTGAIASTTQIKATNQSGTIEKELRLTIAIKDNFAGTTWKQSYNGEVISPGTTITFASKGNKCTFNGQSSTYTLTDSNTAAIKINGTVSAGSLVISKTDENKAYFDTSAVRLEYIKQ